MPLKPVRDLIYILPMDDAQPRTSLIEIPDEFKRRPTQGIVKYRGPQTTGEILVGDHVFFSAYDGDSIYVDGEGLLIVMPERGVDFIWTDSEEFMMTTGQVRKALDIAADQVGMHVPEDQKHLVTKIQEQFLDNLSTRHLREMYY